MLQPLNVKQKVPATSTKTSLNSKSKNSNTKENLDPNYKNSKGTTRIEDSAGRQLFDVIPAVPQPLTLDSREETGTKSKSDFEPATNKVSYEEPKLSVTGS